MRISGQIDTDQFKALVAQKDAPSPPGQNKFSAVPVKRGHDQFDSKHEAGAIDKLRLLQSQGYIRDLEDDKRALKWALDVNGVRICDYEADAKFTVVKDFDFSGLQGVYTMRAGQEVVFDAKSAPTRRKREYVLKKNLLFALYRIRIVEA